MCYVCPFRLRACPVHCSCDEDRQLLAFCAGCGRSAVTGHHDKVRYRRQHCFMSPEHARSRRRGLLFVCSKKCGENSEGRMGPGPTNGAIGPNYGSGRHVAGRSLPGAICDNDDFQDRCNITACWNADLTRSKQMTKRKEIKNSA